MKILIAEDEPILLKTISLRLKKDGHEIITAEDGRDALDKFEQHQPDMVITDIMMPYHNGLEIVGKVKSGGNKNALVIVLSGMGQENVVIEAFDLGADDYITKPFSPNELSIRVKKLALLAQR